MTQPSSDNAPAPAARRVWWLVLGILGQLGWIAALAWSWPQWGPSVAALDPLWGPGAAIAVAALLASLGMLVCWALAFRPGQRAQQLPAPSAQSSLPPTPEPDPAPPPDLDVLAFEHLPAGLFTVDLQGQFVRCNDMAAQILGLQRERLLASSWDQHFQITDWERLLKNLGRSQTQSEIELEFRLNPADKSYRKACITARRHGLLVEGCIQDITERSRAHDYLEFLVRHDPLTKSLNRLGVERHLKKRLSNMKEGHHLALAYMDLDGFKLINDLHGHQAGDDLLVALTKRIFQMLPRGVRLGRIGGDEFLMVFSGFVISEAQGVCEEIIRKVQSEPFDTDTVQVSIGASIGLIEVRAGSQSKDAISHADNACRQAKAQGKGRVIAHGMNDQALLQHESDLRVADGMVSQTMEDNLSFHVQPILSLRQPSQTLYFEVLLQMSGNEGESVPTQQAVSVAKNTGQMLRIDHWVLTTVLKWVRQRKAFFEQRRATIFINLSGASLNDSQMVEDIIGVIEAHRDISSLLCMEVTEDVALKSLYNTRQFFMRLRNLGVRIALDDFGAGYSSFTYLRHLPSDFLKIDGGLIAQINHDPTNVSIVQGIVNMARSLGILVVAEWAEDAACVKTLQSLGVDFVQGYAIGRPMSPQALMQLGASVQCIEDADLKNWVLALESQG